MKIKFDQKWLIFGYGLTLYPWIFIKSSEEETSDWLLYHEYYHYQSQSKKRLFVWIIDYIVKAIAGNYEEEENAHLFADKMFYSGLKWRDFVKTL